MPALKIKAVAVLALGAATLPAPAQAAPERGWGGDGLRWTITVAAPATNVLTGAATVADLGTADWAPSTASRSTAAGSPRGRSRALAVPHRHTAGRRGRAGADRLLRHASAGPGCCGGGAGRGIPDRHGRLDRLRRRPGPDAERVHVAVIDPRAFHGAIDAATEGVVDPRDLSSGYAWSQQRQPRTMAGMDAGGRLLLVTVDGRRPGVSEGVTLVGGAPLMRSLGAVADLVAVLPER